jgi:uncharacterized membrane-anchored protein YjiN (DUF445 family)
VDQEIFDKLVGGLEELLEAMAADATHPARAEIKARLHSLQQALAGDPELAAKSRALKDEIVSETIESWDAAATSRRIELNIGTDLQYIRVNGTLVGGLVGLELYFGTLAFS